MLADALLAISLAISSALAAEVMAWLVIYRKETYKKVTAELEHQQYEQLEELSQSEHANITIEELMMKHNAEQKMWRNNYEKRSRLEGKASWVGFVSIVTLLVIFNGLVDARTILKFPLFWLPEAIYPNYKKNYLYGVAYVSLYFFCLMLLRPMIRKRLIAATCK